MSKKRILLIGGNYHPEPTGIGKYNGEMMDWLCDNGYDCSVVISYPYYPYWKVQPPYEKKSFWYKKERRQVGSGSVAIYRCPQYIPKTPTGGKRMFSDLSFFMSAFWRVFFLLFHKKYDYVITVVPAFQTGLLGVMMKKIRGSQFIYHVQDLQIDAAKELGMIKSGLLLKIMFGIERYILRKADHVSSISEGMIRKIKAKYSRPVLFFPNWVDTEAFFPLSNKDVLKQKFNFLASDKIVLYSGAIGEKQGLEAILNAAASINDPAVKFVICGSGPYKENLVQQMNAMKLTNVFFLPLQPKESFNEFLNSADLHLVLQKANANDLVMPSKLTAILSVGGLALVTAPANSSLHAIIADHEMGILAEPENPSALVDAIVDGVSMPHHLYKTNARRFAEEYLTIDKVLKRFLHELSARKNVQVSILTKEAETVV